MVTQSGFRRDLLPVVSASYSSCSAMPHAWSSSKTTNDGLYPCLPAPSLLRARMIEPDSLCRISLRDSVIVTREKRSSLARIMSETASKQILAWSRSFAAM